VMPFYDREKNPAHGRGESRFPPGRRRRRRSVRGHELRGPPQPLCQDRLFLFTTMGKGSARARTSLFVG
jgi:hypothetical protein